MKLLELRWYSDPVLHETESPVVSVLPGADPWIYPYKDGFLLAHTAHDYKSVIVKRLPDMDHLERAETLVEWKPDASCDHTELLWAPEIHQFPRISDKWFIYYAGCDGDNSNHRMYVLESVSNDPAGPYIDKGKICDKENDRWAIDMTVMDYEGSLYAFWSGWETEQGDFPQNIYCARMSDPYTVISPRVMISQPELAWEKSVAAINEGPQVLMNNGKLYIVYSADASWMPEYKLGLLEFKGGEICNPANWKKFPSPVFEQGQTEAYGPGHASFVTAPNPHIVYHHKISPTPGWERIIKSKPFTWSTEEFPQFGQP